VRKNFWLGALLTLLPTVGLGLSRASPQDEEAVRKVIQQWHESFAKRDADLRNRLLTEDTVFLNAFGVEREGKESVTAFWKELFGSGTFNQSQLTVRREKIRFLRPDLGIVDRFEDVIGQRGVETGKPLPTRKVHLTFVMTKTDKGWLVAYYRAGDLRDPETVR